MNTSGKRRSQARPLGNVMAAHRDQAVDYSKQLEQRIKTARLNVAVLERERLTVNGAKRQAGKIAQELNMTLKLLTAIQVKLKDMGADIEIDMDNVLS